MRTRFARQASAFQLSVLGSANAACLLLSLALARVIESRRPLPWVVWPTFFARALFLLVPFIDAICGVVNVEGRRIEIDPPEGLIDLNRRA